MLGDPLALFHDVLDHPDAYDEGLAVLLQEVVQGSKKLEELDKTDQQLLNDAVLVFAEGHPAPPTMRTPDPEPEHSQRRTERAGTPIERVLAEQSAPTIPAAPPSLPESAPTFWWKKKDEKDQ